MKNFWFFLFTRFRGCLAIRLIAPSALLLTLFFAPTLFAQWEPDRRLTFSDSGATLSFYHNAWCIAVDSAGGVHAVWYDYRDGNLEIYYKRSTDSGSTWLPDIRLTNDPRYSDYPTITLTSSTVHVVWNDERNGNYSVYYKRSTDLGSIWGVDTMLSNYGGLYPSVASCGSGVHVVWPNGRSGVAKIYYKRSTNSGLNWYPDTSLTSDSASADFPSVAATGPDVHVVWRDYRGDNFEIYYKHSTDGGVSWSPEVRLTYALETSRDPSIVAAGSNVHLVWVDKRYGFYTIFYKHSTDRGITWTPDTMLTNPRSGTAINPTIAVSGTKVHVVWADSRDGNYRVYYKCSMTSGMSWERDTALTNLPTFSWFPAVAAVGPMVHLIWEDDRDTVSQIYYKRNPTGNSAVELPGRFQPLTSNLSLSAVPNPFTSFATIPGHVSESFTLYDISGRKVGTYRGDRVGEGLSCGGLFP
jgi:hypothetical protein